MAVSSQSELALTLVLGLRSLTIGTYDGFGMMGSDMVPPLDLYSGEGSSYTANNVMDYQDAYAPRFPPEYDSQYAPEYTDKY